ncbi:tissue factor [Rhinatrema bivittatum]|uniref:tissue factor n=1 Tax=Rhinatrema bivittatum TaxID=194408 RepID=UPI00112B3596|nr:tissue factor [Rhinatrema bivittatum]
MALSPLLVLAYCLCWLAASASGTGNLTTAANITWSSINFKTILEWWPKPVGYVYTVSIAGKKSNWKKKCIYTSETECDVTDLLQDTNDTYTAHIISEVPEDEDQVEEFPFSISEPFTPYKQTIVGKPGIQSYEYNKEHTRLRVVIEDPVTPYKLPNGSLKSIREIFKDDLKYTFYYWRASSTGKKQQTTTTNEIEISVDKGENYCFYAQASISSRKALRDGEESQTLCTGHSGNVLNEYGIGVIIAGILAVVVIIVLIIALSVTLYKCKKMKTEEKAKENRPLNHV